MNHGFHEAAANTNPGSFHVQVTPDSSDGEGWITVAKFTTTAATPTSIDPTNAEAAGQTTIETGDTTGAAVDELRYFEVAAAPADGEWVHVESFVTNTQLDLLDGLANAHLATDLLYSDAERFAMYLDLAGVAAYRVVYIHEGATGANTVIWVRGIEVTAIE